VTEKRAVLHTALRAHETESIFVDRVDVVPEVQEVLDRMAILSSQLRSGRLKDTRENAFATLSILVLVVLIWIL